MTRQTYWIRFLAARDGWVCWICQLPIEPGMTCWSWNSPGSHAKRLAPSLDHVKPASMGGTRVAENLRLAHCYCNGKRGTATITEELRDKCVTFIKRTELTVKVTDLHRAKARERFGPVAEKAWENNPPARDLSDLRRWVDEVGIKG